MMRFIQKTGRARRKGAAKKDVQRQGVWMVTFSDLSTLLLALFVLLFSMSSIDSGLVERISSTLRDDSHLELPGWGRMDSRLDMVLELLKDSQRVRESEKVIKDLLFPDDILPPELDKGMVKRNVTVRARDGGVSIVFSEDVLFAQGSSTIPPEGRQLLHGLTPLLRAAPYDILISGHSGEDLLEGGKKSSQRMAQYQLSASRALVVLALYEAGGVDKRKLSGAGYGADRPLDAPKDAQTEGETANVSNRRVEIMIKNSGATAHYY